MLRINIFLISPKKEFEAVINTALKKLTMALANHTDIISEKLMTLYIMCKYQLFITTINQVLFIYQVLCVYVNVRVYIYVYIYMFIYIYTYICI